MLQGYVDRSEIQKVLLAIMLIADNCCHVRSAIMKVLPLILVLLDVFHFKMRSVHCFSRYRAKGLTILVIDMRQ